MKTFSTILFKRKSVYTRILTAGFIAVFMLASFTSCKPSGSDSSISSSGSGISSSEAASQAAEWGPITLKDANSKDVIISKKPVKIVSLPVWATEILLDAVPNDRIAGISAWGDSAATSATAEKAKKITARVDSKNAEGIIALAPDLVILDTFNDADGSLGKTLGEAGITVILMASPTNFDQIKNAIVTLCTATGTMMAGAGLISTMTQTLAEVEAKVSTLPASEKLTVMYYEDSYNNAGMLAAYGAKSPFNAIATAAGLTNVCDLADYTPVDKEKVVGEWKPQVLVVPSIIYDENYQAIDDKGAKIIAAIKKDTLLASLPAVVNNRIYALTQAYSNSTSHYMAKAVTELAKAAYPALFS